ncbi:MAG: 50S ribosomal protein L24 [Dehalococcoidia bacterium]|nr:50S ribosomal protein L24 [Dehalococcoidia bacterium]
MKIRKNDTVLIIAGREKGKKGKVRRAFPEKDSVTVDGVNMVKRHSRARGAARQAGIIELEAPLNVSNMLLVCGKCNRPVRVGFRFLDDGRKARICRSCHEIID